MEYEVEDYGICQKYVGVNRAFKEPLPKCPECSAKYPKLANTIQYVSDYVTHRIGYHNANTWWVKFDLEEILRREDCCCCCKCDEHWHVDYRHNCCELEKKTEQVTKKIKELDKKLFAINVVKARLESVTRDFKEEYDKINREEY